MYRCLLLLLLVHRHLVEVLRDHQRQLVQQLFRLLLLVLLDLVLDLTVFEDEVLDLVRVLLFRCGLLLRINPGEVPDCDQHVFLAPQEVVLQVWQCCRPSLAARTCRPTSEALVSCTLRHASWQEGGSVCAEEARACIRDKKRENQNKPTVPRPACPIDDVAGWQWSRDCR